MAKINLFASTPPVDLYDPTKPTQQTEFLSWVISKNLENMQAAGMMLDDGQLSQSDLDRLWANQTDVLIKLKERLSAISTTIMEAVGIIGGSTLLAEFASSLYNENTSLLEMDATTVNYYIRKRSINMQSLLVQKLEESIETKEFWRWIGENVPEFFESLRDSYWGGGGGRGIRKGSSRGLPVLFTGLARYTGMAISPYVGVGIILFELMADVLPIIIDVFDNISDASQAAEALAAFKKAFLDQDEEGFLQDELANLANTEETVDLGFAKYYKKAKIVEY
jgi:hypothetical protein